jgi:hypothetical protein
MARDFYQEALGRGNLTNRAREGLDDLRGSRLVLGPPNGLELSGAAQLHRT